MVDLEFVNGQWKPSAATASRLAATSAWGGTDDGMSPGRHLGTPYPSILKPSTNPSARGSHGTAMFTVSHYRQQGMAPSTPNIGSMLHTPAGSGLGAATRRFSHDIGGLGTPRGAPSTDATASPIAEEADGGM